MKVIKEQKLIIGTASEKPTIYPAGWEFFDTSTGKRSLFDGQEWIDETESLTGVSSTIEGTKRPDRNLIFKESPHTGGDAACVAFDGTIWYVSQSGNISKTNDVSDGTDKTEGVAWNGSWGKPVRIAVFPDQSFIVITEINGDEEARIYKFADINDATPTLSFSKLGVRFIKHFGFTHEINGQSSILALGEYNQNPQSTDLLLCTDYGETFNIVLSSGDSGNTTNSHFHDVEYDVFNRVLWASVGDTETIRGIFFSLDLGQNWFKIKNDGTSRDQPTTIIGFPDRVLLGRDSWRAGFDFIKNPVTLEDWDAIRNEEVSPSLLNVTRPDVSGGTHYIQDPYRHGLEAVMSENSATFPAMIYMTGDGGKSVHSVAVLAVSNSYYLRPVWGIDDKYVYATNLNSGNIMYAEKPKWV